jgi:hypothetical protein
MILKTYINSIILINYKHLRIGTYKVTLRKALEAYSRQTDAKATLKSKENQRTSQTGLSMHHSLFVIFIFHSLFTWR